MENSGIYQILSTATGKRYIGSSKSIRNRWYQHRRQLRRGRHTSPRLQRAWNKHGEDNFVFSVLEECEVEKLFEREQWHIDQLKPDYNSMLRVRVVTKEMRGKMNAAMARIAAARTHCPKGHEYTPENVYMGKNLGDKRCKACNRERVAKIYAADTADQRAARNAKNMTNYYANHERNRARANEYSARRRDAKKVYDIAYRQIKNARRRAAANSRQRESPSA